MLWRLETSKFSACGGHVIKTHPILLIVVNLGLTQKCCIRIPPLFLPDLKQGGVFLSGIPLIIQIHTDSIYEFINLSISGTVVTRPFFLQLICRSTIVSLSIWILYSKFLKKSFFSSTIVGLNNCRKKIWSLRSFYG